jgi:hypothetical protein
MLMRARLRHAFRQHSVPRAGEKPRLVGEPGGASSGVEGANLAGKRPRRS